MKKSKILFITDLLAFVCFVFLLSTGVIMKYLLPPGSGRWVNLWYLNRHDWGDIHFWLAMLFLAIISGHLVLHRRWIVAMTAGNLDSTAKTRLFLGVAAGVALVALAFAPVVDFYW